MKQHLVEIWTPKCTCGNRFDDLALSDGGYTRWLCSSCRSIRQLTCADWQRFRLPCRCCGRETEPMKRLHGGNYYVVCNHCEFEEDLKDYAKGNPTKPARHFNKRMKCVSIEYEFV